MKNETENVDVNDDRRTDVVLSEFFSYKRFIFRYTVEFLARKIFHYQFMYRYVFGRWCHAGDGSFCLGVLGHRSKQEITSTRSSLLRPPLARDPPLCRTSYWVIAVESSLSIHLCLGTNKRTRMSSESRMSQYTMYIANAYCGGSSRKLIASWWCVFFWNNVSLTSIQSNLCFVRYAILALSAILMLMSLVVTSTRVMSEGFASFWSAIMLIVLSIGGTMIMRKFHNSFAVGIFMGSVVCMSQLFFILFLV